MYSMKPMTKSNVGGYGPKGYGTAFWLREGVRKRDKVGLGGGKGRCSPRWDRVGGQGKGEGGSDKDKVGLGSWVREEGDDRVLATFWTSQNVALGVMGMVLSRFESCFGAWLKP
ncbi:hypothetical protein PIB30_080264 [Stylosanthes scabra]|uniref:Uncharacterized protein n=1 Tax=Stylosanthes scabra TaxID=79078 RepID=A0ABU6XTX5_9FABA|nr:hypothetical protein [Stylosanthes scabra]